MSSISINVMHNLLTKSVSSNRKNNIITMNKVYGILAEIHLRKTLNDLGYSNRISQGGWIFRNVGNGTFGHQTVVLFPMTIIPKKKYPSGGSLESPPHGLHTICSTMHQIGVHSYYCVPIINNTNNFNSIEWNLKQLGVPEDLPYRPIYQSIQDFTTKKNDTNLLTYNTNIRAIPDISIPDELTKESLRVAFQKRFYQEVSDIDGIFWGQQFTYPVEIKEKTSAKDRHVGEYFGLDVGPFVKLAFYAAKKGQLHSLFIVKEINDTTSKRSCKLVVYNIR